LRNRKFKKDYKQHAISNQRTRITAKTKPKLRRQWQQSKQQELANKEQLLHERIA
jgi:hypothetical protein